MNQSIHNIDMLQSLFNSKCKSVFANIKNYAHPYIEGEDYATAILNFENGTKGLKLIHAFTLVIMKKHLLSLVKMDL